jgi:hypothetical protein
MAKKSPKALTVPLDTATAWQSNQPCLGPCRDCGALVLWRVWKDKENRFEVQTPPLSPLLGEQHVCNKPPAGSPKKPSQRRKEPYALA